MYDYNKWTLVFFNTSSKNATINKYDKVINKNVKLFNPQHGYVCRKLYESLERGGVDYATAKRLNPPNDTAQNTDCHGRWIHETTLLPKF